MHFFVQFVVFFHQIGASKAFFRLLSLKAACRQSCHNPKQTKHTVVIPNIIKKSRRHSPQHRHTAAEALHIVISMVLQSLWKQLADQQSKKYQAQNQSQAADLTKNLQKNLMGVDHRLGALYGVRKILFGKALHSQSDSKGMVANHPQNTPPNEQAIADRGFVEVANALKTVDDITRQIKG